MAILLGSATNGLNLQGTTPTLQGSYNPQNAYNPQGNFIGPTMNMSATVPATPKNTYIQNKAQQIAPQNPFPGYNASGVPNGMTLDAQGRPINQSGQQTQSPQTSNPAPQQTIPNPAQNFNGTSTGVPGQGVYDPYNSPAYQNYLNQYVNSQLPGLTTPQIQAGTVSAEQTLSDIAKQVAQQSGSARNNPGMSSQALTGQTMAAANQGALESAAVQPLLDLYKQQQGQAATAFGAPLATANTEAGYLSGLVKPTAVSPGQSLVLPNPGTGTASTLASVGNYGLGQGIAGQPITYSQTTGAINSGGTGLGATPPTLGGQAGEAGSLQSIGQTYGLTDPASQTALKTAVDQTIASNGDMAAAGVPANLQPAVGAVLSQMSGGTYSPGNASINQSNLAAQQATANQLIAPAKTAASHLADLQALANAVNYSNSPIASNVRNQFSGSILTDPSITTLQSAIGVVRSEVAKVLGGGTPTVASQAEATDALPDNLSPENIQKVIANVQALINQKIQEYSNPANAASLPTGLQMPNNSSSGTIPAGALKL